MKAFANGKTWQGCPYVCMPANLQCAGRRQWLCEVLNRLRQGNGRRQRAETAMHCRRAAAGALQAVHWPSRQLLAHRRRLGLLGRHQGRQRRAPVLQRH